MPNNESIKMFVSSPFAREGNLDHQSHHSIATILYSTMVKKKRQRPTAATTTTEDVDDDDQHRVGWSSIPGKRLDVDLKNKDDENEQQLPKGGKKKRPHPTSNHTKNSSQSIEDEDEFNNLDKWTSQHYDNDSLQDDTDLYNLDDKFDVTNKYDGSMIDGSNDAGMFLR